MNAAFQISSCPLAYRFFRLHKRYTDQEKIMREAVATRPEERANTKVSTKRNRISPELSEVLHMLNSLEDQFASKTSN
jgi:hypothetical protein